MTNVHADWVEKKQTTAANPSPGRQRWLFAMNFFRHPRMLGSLIPSSRYLIERLLRPIDWSRAKVIVEYGPGVGTITFQLLRHMRPDAILIAIDTNGEFVRFLRAASDDPRLHVFEGSAESIDALLRQCGQTAADYVLSGIPFSTIPPAVGDRILRKTNEALRPDGLFLVYQFSSHVYNRLMRVFRGVEREGEWRNVLPAQVFVCHASTAPATA